MTTGRPLKSILVFCGPVLAGSLLQQLYNLADSFIVGRILGVNSFAAVGATGALSFLILGFALGTCSGLAIPIAQSFGARNMDAVRHHAGQLVWLGAILSAALTAVTWVWTDDILVLIRTPEEIYAEAYLYIRIVFLGSGATILYNLLAAALRALGDSRTPLVFLVMTVALNVALDLLFLSGFGMGVEGAALATVLGQLAAGLASLAYIRKKVPALHPRRNDLRPDWRLMARIASLGVPMGLQFSITAVGSVMLQSAVNGLGTGAVAAVAAGSKVTNLVAAPLETCGVAMATYCGQNLGAREIGRIRQGVRGTMLVALIYCAAAFGFIILAGTDMAGLFMDVPDAAVLADVRRYLFAAACAYPALAVIYVFRNALQGMGFASQAMSAGVAELAARAIAAFGLVGSLGYLGVCLASPLAWVLADAMLLLLYHVEMRRLSRTLGGSAPEERPRFHHRVRAKHHAA